MMKFQKLLFNLVLLFLLVSNFAYAKITIINWEANAPFNKSCPIGQWVNYDLGGQASNIYPDLKEIKTYLDFQKAWINWAKTNYIDVKIQGEPIFKFLPRIINEKNHSTKFHFRIKSSIEGVHFNSSDEGRSNEKYTFLKASEPLYSGKTIFDPFGFAQGAANYYDERFFLDDWNPFWKEMEKKALKEGYKSLDGYCFDIYSSWCQKKYNAPFYLFLNPSDIHHHARLFKRTNYREFYDPTGDKLIGSVPYRHSEWNKEWKHILFCVRWVLIFEVWKNEKFTQKVRGNWVRELTIARENGYPYRVSFNFYGTVWDFMDKSIQLYNGKDADSFLTSKGNELTLHL